MNTYVALDATFTFEAPRRLGRVLSAAYADLLAPDLAPPQHVVRVERSFTFGWRTVVDGEVRRRGMDESAALLDVRRAVNDLAESSAVIDHAVLNASAVEVDGTVVGIVGPVVAGKSSLLLMAARRGHGYVADDVMAVRPDGAVRSFHRPVGVRLEVAEQLGVPVPKGPFRDGYPLAMGGANRLSDGGRLGLLVLARRADGLATQHHSASWGLMLLANSALRAAGNERTMFHRVAGLTATVPVMSLWFDDPGEAVDEIEQVLRTRVPQVEPRRGAATG